MVSDEVLRFLAAIWPDNATPTQIAGALRLPRQTVHAKLRDPCKRGRIQRFGRGHYRLNVDYVLEKGNKYPKSRITSIGDLIPLREAALMCGKDRRILWRWSREGKIHPTHLPWVRLTSEPNVPRRDLIVVPKGELEELLG